MKNVFNYSTEYWEDLRDVEVSKERKRNKPKRVLSQFDTRRYFKHMQIRSWLWHPLQQKLGTRLFCDSIYNFTEMNVSVYPVEVIQFHVSNKDHYKLNGFIDLWMHVRFLVLLSLCNAWFSIQCANSNGMEWQERTSVIVFSKWFRSFFSLFSSAEQISLTFYATVCANGTYFPSSLGFRGKVAKASDNVELLLGKQ